MDRCTAWSCGRLRRVVGRSLRLSRRYGWRRCKIARDDRRLLRAGGCLAYAFLGESDRDGGRCGVHAERSPPQGTTAAVWAVSCPRGAGGARLSPDAVVVSDVPPARFDTGLRPRRLPTP